jgi:hypothetical protein
MVVQPADGVSRVAVSPLTHQLGIVAQQQQRLAEAEGQYRQALEIFLEFGDRHSAAIA